MSHDSDDPFGESVDDRLSCGARVAEVLDQIAVGRGPERDAHQARCPHCQAALAEYDRLWAPVRALAHTQVQAPDSVLEEAIRRIRGAVADPAYGILTGSSGTTRVSARVVITTARRSAQDLAGVRVALSKLVADGTTTTRSPIALPTDGGTPDVGPKRGSRRLRPSVPRVVAGVAGRSTAIEITLAADYGIDLIELGERIRTHVAARVRDLTGLEPVTVTVTVDDIFT